MTDDLTHIFVAGPSRSGTALTRSVVNAHPEVFIAGETHWFDDLRTRIEDPAAPLSDDEQRRTVEDHFLALSDRPFGHGGDPEAGWLGRGDLRAKADESGGSADAYFDAFLALSAEAEGGARILGEKTPRHVFRIDEILSCYPQAKMIVMVRDPRAIVASYKDWYGGDGPEAGEEAERTRRTYDPVLLSALWRAQARAGTTAAHAHPGRVMVQRYEDLVTEPETAVRGIADFLGLEFSDAMLEVPLHNSSYSQTQWDAGISAAPVDRWQTKLDLAEVRVVEMVTRAERTRYHYPRLPGGRAAAGSARVLAGSPVRMVRAVVTNRDRMGNPVSYVARRLRAVVRG